MVLEKELRILHGNQTSLASISESVCCEADRIQEVNVTLTQHTNCNCARVGFNKGYFLSLK